MAMLAIVLQTLSCNKTIEDSPTGGDADLALALLTKSGGGELVLSGEDEFTSLAVFVFNDDNGDLEFSELITDFTPESAAISYTKSVRVTKDKKAVYAIANYAGNSFTSGDSPVTITENTTKAVLDALKVSSATFAGDNIAMIGKAVVDMTGTFVNVPIEMERLVGRIDMHVYKAAELTDDMVELVSIEFCNQVNTSNAQYQSKVMPGGNIRQKETYTPPAAKYLGVAPSNTDYNALTPADAEKSFYSYQNISGEDDPGNAVADDATTPYLLVNVKVNGAPVTYRGDMKNTAGLYDLERNMIYKVKAVVGEPNNLLYLRVEVLEWDTEPSAITYDELAFTISSEDDGANYGEVSLTDPATYNFTLTDPAGAVWTANLTNGLDFELVSGGGYFSQGIARADSYYIRIQPTKSFSATTDRETSFYIVVDGEKARINPDGAGGNFEQGRKYPGTETDILIKQIQ